MTDEERGDDGSADDTESTDDGSRIDPPSGDPEDDRSPLDATDAPEIDAGADDDQPELPGETDGERSGPLGDLASRVDQRRQTEADEEFDDLFEQEDAGTVDRDALWEQVGTDDPFDVETEAVEEPERRVVEKAKYCQSCRFFSEPPDVACTHPETEILEVVDAEHFEVFNCPIVRENENLEQL